MNFHVDSETVQTPQGQTAVHRFLDIRLNDLRHQMTTNFQTRSTGFQWFFSFIVAFSEFEKTPNVVVLLDEPGHGLHARAQSDLLRYIEERLAAGCQVVYTTHSPFMVDPRQLQRVRLVEDVTSREDPDIGAVVTSDVLAVKRDTLFPLQAALGYDLAQNLFVGGNILVVEGVSDLVYLTFLSTHFASMGRAGLDSTTTTTPVGGADKVPTFIALLGPHLHVAVLVDEKASHNQRLLAMVRQGILKEQRLLSVGQVIPVRGANIEDLFEPDEYLGLYNAAFGSSLAVGDLDGTDSIVDRIERHLASEYDHTLPAYYLVRHANDVLPSLSDMTIKRFGELFTIANQAFKLAE